MRRSFAHVAELLMDPTADTRSPGAAITVALCGDWDHSPPCPLAPHHSRAHRVGAVVHVRTLFAVEPRWTDAVRQRIDGALRTGELTGPDGAITRWQLRSSGSAAVSQDEADHAARLTRT